MARSSRLEKVPGQLFARRKRSTSCSTKLVDAEDQFYEDPVSLSSIDIGFIGDTFGRRLDQLPRLVNSSADVNAHLYLLFAVVYNRFISSWYDRVSPNKSMRTRYCQLLQQVFATLEERWLSIDYTHFVASIPALLQSHICAYRNASKSLGSWTYPCTDLAASYLDLNGHPAVKTDSESAYKLIVSRQIVSSLVPDPELKLPASQLFLESVVADAVLSPLVDLMSSSNFLYFIILSSIKPQKQFEPHKRSFDALASVCAFCFITTVQVAVIIEHLLVSAVLQTANLPNASVSSISAAYFSLSFVLFNIDNLSPFFALPLQLLAYIATALDVDILIVHTLEKSLLSRSFLKFIVSAVANRLRYNPEPMPEVSVDELSAAFLEKWPALQYLIPALYRQPAADYIRYVLEPFSNDKLNKNLAYSITDSMQYHLFSEILQSDKLIGLTIEEALVKPI
ncbi:hypothetical protein CANCADRAFT_89095 [Tortispora caseinolytica NRRL Y-17796]|uniref:PXA domain-containing protein n=1 Tax=Tortispora caseinolytica NRRL Y-17796 TaxID=767744 RepID=A0A1E4TLD9_9ASCO|nr:hypothetical protein CANCADRAFT_89095 [Tortispora caseinolytica NRRL Y-17796]